MTASGGPFRGKDLNFLKSVNKENALNHPNWEMGEKISIDSSSLMNKGLEVIEAKFLFDIEIKDIDVVIHPESIIHSMVQFNDGSIIAQLGEPDMRLPIQYALGYPERLNNSYKRYDFINSGSLNFEKPCYKTFNNLKLAFDAAEKEDYSVAIELYELLKMPYEEQPKFEKKWFQKRPDWARHRVGCSMLSCSS